MQGKELDLNYAAAMKFGDVLPLEKLKFSISTLSNFTIIFLLWRLSSKSERLYNVLNRNFLLNVDNIAHNRYWNIVTCGISHMTTLHFICNSIALLAFAPQLENEIGFIHTTNLFYGGVISGSLASLFSKRQRFTDPRAGSLGGSAGIYSMVVNFTLLHPSTKLVFIFFPFVEFEATTLLPILLGIEALGAYRMISRSPGFFNFDHFGHLGGAAFGIIYYFLGLSSYHKPVTTLK